MLTIISILATKVALNREINVTEIYLVIQFVNSMNINLIFFVFINFVIDVCHFICVNLSQ